MKNRHRTSKIKFRTFELGKFLAPFENQWPYRKSQKPLDYELRVGLQRRFVPFALLLFYFNFGFFQCTTERVFNSKDFSDANDYKVDTRLGTGGILWSQGHVSPAATLPFGMVSLGPDSAAAKKMFSSSGYSYSDSEVIGFSMTRFSGTGLAEGGILRLTPSRNSLKYSSFVRNYLPLDHNLEVAEPGYYSILFAQDHISAQMAAHKHSGIQSYDFGNCPQANLILELTSTLSSGGAVTDLSIHFLPSKQAIEGHFVLKDEASKRYDGLPIYFKMVFSRPWIQAYTFNNNNEESANLDQDRLVQWTVQQGRLFFNFEFSNRPSYPIVVKTAISYVSLEGARNNFESEVQDQTLSTLKEMARTEWRTIFSKIEISSDRWSDKSQFYTALYHSFLMPQEVSDSPTPTKSSYSFLGYDHQIKETSSPYYATFSLWDTFRTVHPLYTLIAPTQQTHMVQSLLQVAKDNGRMPRWGAQGGHTDSMLGFPAHIMVAESYLKGIPMNGLDAFLSMDRVQFPRVNISKGQECLIEYKRLGFCPLNFGKGSVSYTLEYAYADYSLGLMAEQLQLKDAADYYRHRSENFKNIWNNEIGLFAPRHQSGGFAPASSANDSSYLALNEGGKSIFEGSLHQWKWYVPFRREAFLGLMQQGQVNDLESFLENSSNDVGAMYPGTNYWHGNEPDLHAAYLFNWLGRPDLTQKWVAHIRKNHYANRPRGIDGEDDAGTISAWYVWSSLGFYPIAGTTQYLVGTPLWENAKMKLGEEKTLVIRKLSKNPDWIYVKAVSINGVRLNNPWFDHKDIKDGGEIIFEMSENPISFVEAP